MRKLDEEWGLKVGEEARKNFSRWLEDGFIERYLSGEKILDIGFQGYLDEVHPITPNAIGIDLEYPGYDGRTLPFDERSQDAVFVSHCLEHIEDYRTVIADWFRVLRVGGYLIIAVPHQYLYERKLMLPSRFNLDHRRFYTPGSLMREIEEALDPMSYRVRMLTDNDRGFDYSIPPEEHAGGCYEILFVAEKIERPEYAPEVLRSPKIRNETAGTFVSLPRPSASSPVRAISGSKAPETIVVFKLDHLGDFILARPALERLRAAFPEAQLTLVCGAWNAGAARELGIFDEVVEFAIFERNAALNEVTSMADRLLSLRKLFAGRTFDLAIDLRIDEDTRDVLENVTARTRAGFGWPKDFDFLDISMPVQSPTVTGRAGVWIYDARRFYALAGTNDGLSITIEPGCYAENQTLIYGPYCKLEPADYEVTLHLADETGAMPPFRYDIVCDSGNLTLAYGDLADPGDGISFRLDNPVDDLEIRIFATGVETGRLVFRGCTINKEGVTLGPHQTEMMAMLVALVEQRMAYGPRIDTVA
ncbi:methyltransferase domain-containing protein [Aurantiacibacter poecillastricola]|uniref:methyltransferase domain-containing protein n=1 Tax=Aurantiacibacter poecillastricola TaxID=3064385 RepID=UPI00273ECBBB|nr:methyltransferase domain-containing protein [Aurantiacibacter sp. 219JJ12-13]MDP5261159.1 methyltransferase domain-containing protein [Aurantiacibacter sp. 219JJ12-13]